MITLSNRGFPMLNLFVGGNFMTYAEAHKYDQRPFRSMIIRDYIRYHPRKGFKVTQKGLDAWREFCDTDIARKNPAGPLASVFDPAAWGLGQPSNVREIKKSA